MRVVGLILLLLAVGAFAFAEAPKVSIDVKDASLSSVVAQLSKQADVRIILDKDVSATVTAQLSDVDLEKVLNMVIVTRGLKWQKLYGVPDETGSIPFETIKAQVNALNVIRDTPVVLFDPETGKQTVFARVEQTAAEKAIDPEKLGMKPFYYVFKPKPPEEPKKSTSTQDDPMKKLADIQKQRMEAYLKMTPEQQKAAAEQDMMWMLSLPQDSQVRMMTGMFDAMRNMDQATRDQFRRTMRSTFRQMRPDRQQRGQRR
jgi:hypothetical protein